MTKDVMLTTIDNPYNPHHNFDEWKAYDEEKRYFTCEYLARLAPCSDSLTDEENMELIDNAIQDIIDFDPLGIYMRIFPDTTVRPINIFQSQALDTVGGL